jgi:hypothetical protein
MKLEQAFAALRFEPALPLWLLVALAVLCALALGLALWRRAAGTVWRALAFAVLLLWLSGPRLIEESRQIRPDIALLVIDQTASMHVNARTQLAERARAALEVQGRALPDLELRMITVPDSDGGSQLFAAIDRALADIPRARLAGIIAVTDGQVHDIPQTLPVPLHVLIPAAGEEIDRRVRIVSAPGYGIVGHNVELRVAIDDLGVASPNATTRLTLRRDGEAPVRFTLPVGRDVPVQIPITRAGPTVIELTAETLAGEVSPLNNRAVVTVNGVRDRLRVLLVSGEPHAGERTWRRLLKADPAVDLVHFTILRPPEKDDFTPLNELALIPFPVRELFQVKIQEFDLIILDRFSGRGLLPPAYLRNIADYVRAGGALLMSAGAEFSGPQSLAASPLGAVLPAKPVTGAGVTDGAFHPQITPLGTRHPMTENLPGWYAGRVPEWGAWYRITQSAEVRGDVLMTGAGDQPLLITDHVGEGRVALLLSDQIWLWSRGHQGGGPQAELLRRMAHWLMKEPALDEEALLARIEAGQLMVERRSTQAAPKPGLIVTDPDGVEHSLKLVEDRAGHSAAQMEAGLPGVWRVGDGTRTAYAASDTGNSLELADLRATATKLAQLADASGGSVRFLEPAGAPALRRTEPARVASGGDWIGLPRRGNYVVTGITTLPLLPPALALPLILGLMMLAWRREGA